MEPSENRELNDQELDELLRDWKTPLPSRKMRARLFASHRQPWWRRIWTMSIRIPLPVAVCLALAAGLSARQWMRRPQPRVLIKTERIEVPVVTERIVKQTIYRNLPAARAAAIPKLRPVTELRPRIIRRSQSVEN